MAAPKGLGPAADAEGEEEEDHGEELAAGIGGGRLGHWQGQRIFELEEGLWWRGGARARAK